MLADIRGAALALFVDQGYEATTLAQIAAAVGYSKSALLYHFESKEALLLATLEAPLARLHHYLETDALLEADRLPGFVDLVLLHRDEAALLFQQGAKMKQVATLESTIDGALEALVGSDASLERRVAVHVVMGGILAAATDLRDVEPAALRPLLIAVGTRLLSPHPA